MKQAGAANVVNIGDPFVLYNTQSEKFMSAPEIRLTDDGKTFMGIPNLVTNPQQAGIFIFSGNNTTSFAIRTVSNLLDDDIYLSIDSNNNLFFGDSLYLWQSDPVQPILYNRIYYIVSTKNHKPLQLESKFYVQEANIPQWVFLSLYTQYTCDKDVSVCSATRGRDNIYSPTICSSHSCQNRFGEDVYFSHAECETRCGVTRNDNSRNESGGNRVNRNEVSRNEGSTPNKSHNFILLFIAFLFAWLCFLKMKKRVGKPQ